jgi:predicted dehydrogenase
MQPPTLSLPADSPINVAVLVEGLEDLHALQAFDLHPRFHLSYLVTSPDFPLSKLPLDCRRSDSVPHILADKTIHLIRLPGGSNLEHLADRIQQTLNAGKHIILGQPVEFPSHLWDRLRQTAAQAQRTINFFFPGEFDPEFQLASHVAKSGRLGRLRKIVYQYYSYSGPALITAERPLQPIIDPLTNPGLFVTRGLEALRLLTLLHPHPTRRIFARQPNDKNLTLQLEFDDGLLAHWELALDHPAPRNPGWYLHGSHGGYTEQAAYRIEPDGELVKTPLIQEEIPPRSPLFRFLDHLATTLPRNEVNRSFDSLFLLANAARSSLQTGEWETVPAQ